MLKWSNDKAAYEVQRQIMHRAGNMAKELGINYPNLDILMDIDACHCNGCPLQLQALLDADDANFAHDVFGIRQHSLAK